MTSNAEKLIIGLLFWLVTLNGYAASYSRSAEFSALNFTHTELQDLLLKLDAQLISTNREASSDTGRKLCSFSAKNSKVEVSGIEFVSALTKFPSPITDFRFSYYLANAGISSVSIDFTSNARSIRVEGTSPDAVDTFVAMLTEKITSNQRMLGGGGLIYFIKSLFLLGTFFTLGLLIERIQAKDSKRVLRISSIWVIVICVYNLVPWETWFAGFLLYPQEKSWLVMYSPEIGLIGLILAIVAPAFQYLSGRNKIEQPRTE